MTSKSGVERSGRLTGGVRLRLQAVVLLLFAGIAATVVLNSMSGTAQANEVFAPGAEQEYRDFVKVRERNLANPAAVVPAAQCENGMAGEFPCQDVDLLSHVNLLQMGLSFVNDIWGWTDSMNGDEYALVGGIEGTVAVRVTDPANPEVIAGLPTAVRDESGGMWRDIKVYNDHAFIVSEINGHGMQVFDLTELRPLTATAGRSLTAVANYDGVGSAHNIAINEESGFAYIVGAAIDGEPVCNGGLHIVDISAPADPTFVSCWDAGGYVHDTQCDIYGGPDEAHTGKEICVNSIANFMLSNTAGQPVFSNVVAIVDVSDKENPIVLSFEEYGTGVGYSHQGWMTPDQSYFVHGDELDEANGVVPTTVTRVWDMRDLDAPQLIGEPTNGVTAIDHNMYTRGGLAYQSNYQSGLRIRSLSDIGDGSLDEVAFFDMYPEGDNPVFEGGTWSNYPYFKTPGLIAVSSIDRGLFLLGHRLLCDNEPVSVDLMFDQAPTDETDVIMGTDGVDVIDGLGGDDIICGLGGRDVISGGDGDDRIFGGGGADNLQGGGGSDLIYGGGGHDRIDGGDGYDTIFGQPGGDTIRGGTGNDSIFGGPGFDTIYGDDGADNLQGAGGNDVIFGGMGDDAIYGKPGDDQLHGDAGADELYGASGADEIYGGDDNDRLQGAGGNDILDGGAGDDLMYGQNDDDVMRGGTGNDVMYASAGDDRLFGGGGDDNLQGAGGDDELRGQDDDDLLFGGPGTDIVDGGAGADTCFGSGADQILQC